jgi:hypothetical protein
MFEAESPLPGDLESISPGHEMASLLATVDRKRLPGHDRVRLMKARARLIAHEQAELCADMIAVSEATEDALHRRPIEEVVDSAVWEIRAALNLTRRSAECQFHLAEDLVERMPGVWHLLRSGVIDLPRARVMVDETRHLDEGLARDLAEKVSAAAPGDTTGELRARLQRLIISADPQAAKARYHQGLEERSVGSDANIDGTANVYGLHLPTAHSARAMRRINRLARAAKARGDDRTMDQIRADVFLDLLLGSTRESHTGSDRGVVGIHVDLVTLVGLAESPARIPGWGPVISDIARQVVAEQSDSDHRVTVTGGDGEIVWTGTTRRRPTVSQRRQLEAETVTCVFPGCRMPAGQCDIDHNVPWSCGGPTEQWNMGPLCRHDHVGKHRGWDLKRVRPGVYRWVSPLGHTYEVMARPP